MVVRHRIAPLRVTRGDLGLADVSHRRGVTIALTPQSVGQRTIIRRKSSTQKRNKTAFV
jgi:hypothetical protein